MSDLLTPGNGEWNPVSDKIRMRNYDANLIAIDRGSESIQIQDWIQAMLNHDDSILSRFMLHHGVAPVNTRFSGKNKLGKLPNDERCKLMLKYSGRNTHGVITEKSIMIAMMDFDLPDYINGLDCDPYLDPADLGRFIEAEGPEEEEIKCTAQIRKKTEDEAALSGITSASQCRAFLKIKDSEYAEKLKAVFAEWKSTDNTEKAHMQADKLLVHALSSLGFNKTVDEFEKMPKCYS